MITRARPLAGDNTRTSLAVRSRYQSRVQFQIHPSSSQPTLLYSTQLTNLHSSYGAQAYLYSTLLYSSGAAAQSEPGLLGSRYLSTFLE